MKGSHSDRPGTGDGAAASRDPSESWSGRRHGGPSGTSSCYLPRFFVESSKPLQRPSSEQPFPAAALGEEYVLGSEDAHHALRVLRLGLGDECEVVVTPPEVGRAEIGAPKGAAYLAVVTMADDKVRVKLVAHLEGRQAGADYLTAVGIVQVMTRPSAMDYMLEKGTEVGASFFFVLPMTGSSSRPRSSQSARLSRWRRITREAAKQSKQLAVPRLEMLPGSVDEALGRLGTETLSLVLEPKASEGLGEFLFSGWGMDGSLRGSRSVSQLASLALWVGPESGWSVEELATLQAAGARAVRLGQSVLRAETAGPVAVAVARLALGDW